MPPSAPSLICTFFVPTTCGPFVVTLKPGAITTVSESSGPRPPPESGLPVSGWNSRPVTVSLRQYAVPSLCGRSSITRLSFSYILKE